MLFSRTTLGALNAWIDFNNDGDFDDPGEQIKIDRFLTPNTVNVQSFFVPADVVPSAATAARFRLSTQRCGGLGLAPTGLAAEGEVEDYMVEITTAPEIHGRNYEDLSLNGQLRISPADAGSVVK